MELQVLLMVCGVGVAGAAVLLLMGLFSASGTSYEEAIAQQRKATTELLALVDNKNKNKKNNKKAIKKLAKKEKNKENTSAATASEPESEAHGESGADEDPAPATKLHVEFSPPVVVDVARDTLPNVKIRKRGKDAKIKPILLNKEDPSCINGPNTPLPDVPDVSNHFEEMHPKDEFELLQSSLANEKVIEKKEEVIEKKEAKPVKQTKSSKSSPKITAPALEEDTSDRRNSGDAAPKEQRKGKKAEKKSISEDTTELQEEIVPPLNVPQPSELTTEKLLKQALAAAPAPPSSTPSTKSKKKKNDPASAISAIAAGESGSLNVSELVRVVRESGLSKTEIQVLVDELLNMHHDLLPQHSDWSEGPNDPMQKLKKQLADKEKALADEIEASQAIHAKLKELRATLNAERTRATAAARGSEAAAAAHRADAHTLQARLQRLADEQRQDKLMLQAKLNTEAEAQAQRVQMEMHIQRLSESEVALIQQLNAVQAELSARVVELDQARCEAAQASQLSSQQMQQLQEANRACAELEQQRNRAILADHMVQKELRQMQERLSAMSDLQNEVQRLNSCLQSAEANTDKINEEAEKQKLQLNKEIASLKEQLVAREAELAELKIMKSVPAQNGLPPKAADLSAVEGMVEAMKAELAEAQRSTREQREQLDNLTAQLASTRAKNDELRTKNWKIMEALQTAEKALQSKGGAKPAQESVTEAVALAQEVQYKEIANILRSICPAAAPGSNVNRAWLEAFAENLKKELQKQETKEIIVEKIVVDDKKFEDLRLKNEQLQGVVDKYKGIIDDTEGVLSRLQQNVATEEARWSEKLLDKQRELDALRLSTLAQMQSKIDALELELQKANSSQSHIFADSERVAQEKLLAGLTECNGPLQVGLGEK